MAISPRSKTEAMQEINWGQFNAKFDGKQQIIFQWLCYLLFSIENGQYLGIARYHDHAGIESVPIKVGDEWVGWQAKFYDTPLSSHKRDFIGSINTAKERHPELTKIVFYTNKDFGQDKKKTDPRYKKEIEEHAKSKGVSIDWKPAWFFESVFVTRDNAKLVKFFFSPDKGIIDLIWELNEHSSSILTPIRSTIPFNGKVLKIDRTGIGQIIVKALADNLPVILSGDGGVGKTAVVKDIYDANSKKKPMFVFKATEFNNLTNINDLVSSYGGFTTREFIDSYDDVTEKYIVIDSAEKLADIVDQDILREFIGLALGSKWQIVFTTRRIYLDDLRIMLTDSYGVSFQTTDIPRLTLDEVELLSSDYGFELPSNDRMVDLIRNPFYLNEYLRSYGAFTMDVTYTSFKKLLWDKQIAKSSVKKDGINRRREDTFLELARRRANQGSFSVDAGDLDSQALQQLLSDEVIGYDDKVRQHFITHDIYEEWALDRIVETAFQRTKDDDAKKLFGLLGESLPIRRAFRYWLSDKLLVEKDSVRGLIESSINDQQLPSFWRDEVLVSVLLSDHALSFFELFEKELLADEGKLLVRVTFLMRIACKSIDEDMLRRFGYKRFQRDYALQTLFTTPRGSGWEHAIAFIDKHKETLGLNGVGALVALLTDWNAKHSTGSTTRHAGIAALFYYNDLSDKDMLGYGRRDDFASKLIKVILSGSSEIKDELSTIVDEVTASTTFNHRSKYYPLAEAMLSSVLNSTEVAKAIPTKVLQLARYVWMRPQSSEEMSYGAYDMNAYFGITASHNDTYPPSALQTPISILLQTSMQETIDFILSFTNKAVEAYRQSELSQNETEEIDVHIGKEKIVKQLASHRLWGTYRGDGAGSSILQSMHVALEKWLLGYAKSASQEGAEKICIYLLEHSKSVSITAVVVSAVMSQPYKLSKVATVLFRTKKLFAYDKARYVQDQTRKSSLEMLRDTFPQSDFMTRMHQDERITAADDQHRKIELESLAVNYQFFKPEDIPTDIAEATKKEIWQILDDYYAALPPASKETEHDKVWRLCLARMDRRKMRPTTEHKDGQTLISLNPDLDPDLRKFSDEAQQKYSESQKHIPLKLWASYRWQKEADKYKSYELYEKDPKKVIEETKEIIAKLKVNDEDTQTFDGTTPVYACAVLMRDFADKLTHKEKEWCKDVILGYASRPIDGSFSNVFVDGTDAAIGALPYVLGLNKEDDKKIKSYLLLVLFNRTPIRSGQTLSDLSLVAILHHLWKINYRAAQSIFLGYLLLGPKYDLLQEELRQENIKKQIYSFPEEQVLKELDTRYNADIQSVLNDTIVYDDVATTVESADLHILVTAFELIPYRSQEKDHKDFLSAALPRLAERVFDDEHRFSGESFNLLEKITHFILTSKIEDISIYLKPFIDQFDPSGEASELIEAFISAANKLDCYDQFWTVWDLLYTPVVEISKKFGYRSDTKQVIRNYLLAWRYWKETVREWYILKDKNRSFYKKASSDMGCSIAVLYSLAKVLYDIGSNYIEDGIIWLSDLLEKNPDIYTGDLEVNTVYHLEHILRRYISSNRQKIKSSPALKKRVIKILDFLIEKASVAAYVMREDIL